MSIQIIHIVLGKANPERMNGVNKVVNSLATYQTILGHDVSVWGITKDPIINYPDRNYKTVLFQDKGKFRLEKELETQIKSLDKAVAFHIHGAFIPQFYLIAKLLVKHSLSYTYTPHGAYNTVALQRSAMKKKVYIALFEKYIVAHAHKLHFIGASEVQGSEKIFGLQPFALIPNGQNLEELSFDFSSLSEKDIPIFGFVGRLDMHTKGLDKLLQGFAGYVDRTVDAGQLWIVGDGPDRLELEVMAQNLGLYDQVKFLGSKYGAEKLNIMANMDCFCLTSRNEGLPGVVLEAAALGVPALVSKETNMGDYVIAHESGICLGQNNSHEIASALNWMHLNKNEWKAMSHNAKEMIVELFDWNNISARLVKSYQDAA